MPDFEGVFKGKYHQFNDVALVRKDLVMMKKVIAVLLTLMLLSAAMTGCGQKTLLDPKEPVHLTMWHVYGEQADSPMNRLVDEFNQTVGKEKGIVIDVTLVSGSSKIGGQLIEAQADALGALEMPDLYSCHPSTAAVLGAENMLDWSGYFSEEELAEFVPEFLQDGTIDGKLTVFPVSKSSYALFINGSQFERFSADTGVTYQDLADWDGFFDAAAKYYEWSGGKTFCAFDYLIRHVEFDVMSKDGALYSEDGWYDYESPVLRESWLQFARSLVQGHIAVSDLYANTQVMTGETVAGLGSTAAILYYNDTVTYSDNTSEPTNLKVLPLPLTAGKSGLMPQTGVGLAASKTTEQKAEAASVFAHWFTESERNLDFVVDTGYMPVNNGAFAAIDSYQFPSDGHKSLYTAIKAMREDYTAVVRPTFDDFYKRVDVLYENLREMQPQFKERAAAGEDIYSLTLETWEMFTSIS